MDISLFQLLGSAVFGAATMAVGVIIGQGRTQSRPAQNGAEPDEIPDQTPFTPEQRRKTAIHEAGHVVVSTSFKRDSVLRVSAPDQMTLDTDDGVWYGGVTEYEDIPMIAQRNYFYQMLVRAYGGITAEEAVSGFYAGYAISDLNRAVGIAQKIIVTYGIEGCCPIGYIQLHEDRLGAACEQDVYREILRLCNLAYQEAKKIIEANKPLVEAIAQALLEKGELNREELLALRDQHASQP